MVNQTLGGVSPIDFIKSNFEGAFKIKRLDDINPGLGKALMVVRRGSMLDMPNIGGFVGMDDRADSNIGILIKMGAPQTKKERGECGGCKCGFLGVGKCQLEEEPFWSPEEQLFRAIAKQHLAGRLAVVGGKHTDSTRYYLALGLVDDAFAQEYKLVSVEMMYLYDSFPQGIQPQTGFATEFVVSAQYYQEVARHTAAKYTTVNHRIIQDEIESILDEEM